MEYRFPTADQIRQRLHQGLSYTEAIDGVPENTREFNKYANFKITTHMADNKKQRSPKKDKKLSPEEINKDNFVWRTGNEEHSLDEMDLMFKLKAYTHALKKANTNFEKRNKYRRQAAICHGNVEYFMKLLEILEESLLEDHNLQVPSEVDDVKAMRRMIKEGIMSVENFNAKE